MAPTDKLRPSVGVMPEITPGDKLRLSVGTIPEVDRRMGPGPIGQATVPGGEIRPGEIMSVHLPTVMAIEEQLGEVEEEEIPPTIR